MNTHIQSLKFLTSSKALLLLSATIVIYLITMSPINMDEFVHYHAFDCWFYPGNQINNFREGCGIMDLSLFGKFLPLRSYAYVGSGPGWIYAPIFWLFPHYYSARILGFIALLVMAYPISKVFELRYSVIVLALTLLFPVSFQFLMDTGPVSFQFAFAFIAPYLLVRFPKSIFIVLLVALAGFYCLWTKTFFIVLAPFCLAWSAYLIVQRDKINPISVREILPAFVFSGIICGLLFCLLLHAQDRLGVILWYRLSGMNKTYPLIEALSRTVMRDFLLNFSSFSDRNLVSLPSDFFLTPLFFITLSVLIGYVSSKGIHNLCWNITFIVVFFLTYILVNRNQYAANLHHILMVFPSIIFLILFNYKQIIKFNLKGQKYLLAALLIIALLPQFHAFARVSYAAIRPENDWSIVEINKNLKDPSISGSHIIVVVHWGAYFFQSLYGNKDQSVVYIEPMNSLQAAAQLKDIASRLGRKPLFIARKDAQDGWINVAKTVFPDISLDSKLTPSDGIWGVWR
jgi:hypothetical protein